MIAAIGIMPFLIMVNCRAGATDYRRKVITLFPSANFITDPLMMTMASMKKSFRCMLSMALVIFLE